MFVKIVAFLTCLDTKGHDAIKYFSVETIEKIVLSKNYKKSVYKYATIRKIK
jgi:hypothetical protein